MEILESPIFEIFDDEVYRMRYFYFPSDVITKLRSYELVAELPWLKYLDSNYLFWSRLTFFHLPPKPCTNFQVYLIDGVTRIFLTSNAANKNQTLVSLVTLL